MPKDEKFIDDLVFKADYVMMTGNGCITVYHEGRLIGRAPFRVDGTDDPIRIGYGTQEILVDEVFRKKGVAEELCRRVMELSSHLTHSPMFAIETIHPGMAKIGERLGFSYDRCFKEKTGIYCLRKG